MMELLELASKFGTDKFRDDLRKHLEKLRKTRPALKTLITNGFDMIDDVVNVRIEPSVA